MNIAIIGYGKMGKEIEKIAIDRNHKIILKIDKENTKDLNIENLKNIDVAIEFTNKNAAINNYYKCFDAGVPIVSGTTGIPKKEFEKLIKYVETNKKTFFWASNFSLGVNIFFEINKTLAKLMNRFNDYKPFVKEIHHTQKLDAPSGTAITIADEILNNIDKLSSWVNKSDADDTKLQIKSERVGEVPGTHIVKYKSNIDEISIKHEAFSRKGFALGAVLAAEYVYGKTGVFSMKDLLFKENM